MPQPTPPFAPEPMPEGAPEPAARLRPHPAQRFAGPGHVFDLQEAVEELEREPHEATRGHRQKTLLRHGPATLVLFVFEAGAHLREHRAPGWVTIHVLDGDVMVSTPERAFDLDGGTLVALDPDVPHSVTARQKSRMLLSIVLRDAGDAA